MRFLTPREPPSEGCPEASFRAVEEVFGACVDDGKSYLGSDIRKRGGPKLENACPGLPFGYVTSTRRPKDRAPRDASNGYLNNNKSNFICTHNVPIVNFDV